MASARLERTTIELADDNGKAGLRATGQVVIFPGFLTLYQESFDDPEDEDSKRLPKMAQGDRPDLGEVKAEQHFTQPPPRYSEASLVKKLEELGIGRPSTYASTLQTLKDRTYVLMEKNRFIPEEKGRLVTAFLERFFERYVSYDFTAELEESLDDISGGRAQWQKVLDAFWRDFKPKTAEVMEQKPSEVTQALDEFLAPMLFPDRGDGSDPRACPACGDGRLSLRGGRFGAFIACSNYPECKFTRKFAQDGGGQDEGIAADGPVELGADPDTGEPTTLRSGRFGPYVQRGERTEDGRYNLPKDLPADGPSPPLALNTLSYPAEKVTHHDTGKPITASIGRYGPYLRSEEHTSELQSLMRISYAVSCLKKKNKTQTAPKVLYTTESALAE